MGLRIRHIATRFALLLAVAAVLPLLVYGAWSILSLQGATRQSIVSGNLNVATRAAEEIRRYISTDARLLKAVAANLQGLSVPEKDNILKGYGLDFPEFAELTLVDESGAALATSTAGKPRLGIPRETSSATFDDVGMSPIHIDKDLLPTTIFALHLAHLNEPDGWLVGEISLEEMWRMVDRIRIGEHGFALVVAHDGSLIAHGAPDKKALVAQSRNMAGHHPLVAGTDDSAVDTGTQAQYFDEDGREQLAVSTTIPELNWTVIVEQPTSEAYAGARELQRNLTIAIGLALFVMLGVGLLFGRRFIAPIFKLQEATQSVAAGKLETRVEIGTEDEFGKLGDAFNTMANRLVELQENVKRQERQAMFGRLVGGLFHDLMHPIQNIGNNARLMIRPDLDSEAQQSAHQIIERELGILKRFMDDVLNIAKPKPLQKFPMDVNSSVAEIVDAMRGQGESAGDHRRGAFRERPDGDRGRPLLARPRVPQPDQERAAGDAGRRTGHRENRPHRRSRGDQRQRHRIGYPARAALEDLRRLRDHEEPGPGPRAGDFKADRRAARRHDYGSERGGTRHVVHLAVPGTRRPVSAGRGKLSVLIER